LTLLVEYVLVLFCQGSRENRAQEQAEMGAYRSMVTLAIILAATLASSVATADEIALSLVHPKGRIDVPVSSLGRVEAHATVAFRNTETGVVHEYPDPGVEVCFAKDVAERVCQLTRQIVGQELAIMTDCETLTRPVVREPLGCTSSCLRISIFDFVDANALAQRIRRGSNRSCAPSS
jgi:preprotein translocase subunit SecD